MRVFTKIPPDWNASHFYRQLQPLAFMNHAGHADVTIDRFDSRMRREAVAEAMAYADINMHYQMLNPVYHQSVEQAAKWKSYWRTQSEWVPPTSFVMDTDDDLFNVSPLNHAFKTLGIQVDGRLLEPGEEIKANDKDDNPVTLWRDGEGGFDIARNRATLDSYRHNLAVSALVTCSTPRSQAYVLREAPNANTLVVPNCINFDDYPAVELADKGQEIRMLWQGSSTHLEDLHPLRAAIKSLLDRYPNLTLTIWGTPYIDPQWDPSRVKYLDWCDYREYKVRMACINHDINLAPLSPTVFNQSRSAIKVYESAALARPIPTVAQNTAAYGDEMVDGETALLYNNPEEFEAQVSKLVEDAELRRTIGYNCRDWLKANRDPAIWAEYLATNLKQIRQVKADVWGPPPPEEITVEPVSPDVN